MDEKKPDGAMSDIELAHMKTAHADMMRGAKEGVEEFFGTLGQLPGLLDDALIARCIKMASTATEKGLSSNWNHLFSFLVGEAHSHCGEEFVREALDIAIAISRVGIERGII